LVNQHKNKAKRRAPGESQRTRTRTNTNPNGTEANAAGRSGNARALRKQSKCGMIQEGEGHWPNSSENPALEDELIRQSGTHSRLYGLNNIHCCVLTVHSSFKPMETRMKRLASLGCWCWYWCWENAGWLAGCYAVTKKPAGFPDFYPLRLSRRSNDY